MKNVHLKDMRNGPEPQRGETAHIGNEPCAALSGLPAMVTLNPGLAPWAFLCRPFGACFDARFGAHTGTPLRRPGFSRETRRACMLSNMGLRDFRRRGAGLLPAAPECKRSLHQNQ